MYENDLQPPARNSSNNSKVVQFHTRNTLAIVVILSGMIISFLILLAAQYQKSETLLSESIKRHFLERVNHLDSLMGQASGHLRGARNVAEADLLETRIEKDFQRPGSFHFLENAENSFFHMDRTGPPFTSEMIGNLTGDGSILDRDRNFYREVRMALHLNPLFRSTRDTIETAAWVYYISADNFINLYPRVASSDWKFTRESFDKEFFTLGLPENNPDRKVFWTRVYLDEVGIGFMTTCGTPIYDGDRFLGVVAIDLTIDFLNRIVENFRPNRGAMFLVNDSNQLLAHPKLASSKDKSIKDISHATPPAIQRLGVGLDGASSNEISRIGGYLVIKSDLQNAPWKAFYIEPTPSLTGALIDRVGLNVILLLGGLLVLVVIVLSVNHFFFVLPAEKFVQFILTRNNWEHSDLDQRVPGMWKPWFGIVDNTFRKNEELTNEIQNHSSLLEQHVKERTIELEKVNSQLRMEIMERKGAEDALKESEKRLRTAGKAAYDLIYEWDVANDRKLWFGDIDGLLGFGKGHVSRDIDGWLNVIHPGDKSSLENVVETHRRSTEPIDYEYRVRHADGDYRSWMDHGLPLLNDEGLPYKWIGVCTDVTASRRAEAALRKSEKKLARSEKMESMGLLAGGVAHDLNNILSGIVTYPELLLLDIPEESKLRKPIEVIKRSGDRAAAIVEDLLTVARGVATNREPLNVNDVVDDYLQSPEFEKLELCHPDVAITSNLDKELFNIKGSHIHIRKVVMNLASNASEAIVGGGNVVISTMNRCLDAPLNGYDDVNMGEYAILSVADDGPGIHPDVLGRIFEPFYTKKIMGRSGTGLGLAVIWNVVKDHKGYINVVSDENGTTFELYFPITRDALFDADAPMPIQAFPGNGEKILVVDDDESQREISCKMLDRLGYKSSAVSSGEEAVEYVKEQAVDLLLLDMIMEPGMNGRETYERVIEICPGQKAVIVSGFAETDDVRETRKLGAGPFIRKPVALEKIGLAIKEELQKERALNR